MTWHVIVNDLIGGWCVASLDRPLSEWDFRYDGGDPDGKVIAECWSEEDARLIADLLNETAAP